MAGLLETGWAIGLKYTEGFSRLLPSVLTIASMVASLGLLGRALRSLPVGTAYVVWTGIGATGTALLGRWLSGEPRTAARIACMGLTLRRRRSASGTMRRVGFNGVRGLRDVIR